jgi:hypothetical protein
LTASNDKTIRAWTLSIPALRRLLREATTDCLSPEMRQTYLGEAEAKARRAYEECERDSAATP